MRSFSSRRAVTRPKPSHQFNRRAVLTPEHQSYGPRALGGTSLTWGGQLLPFPDDSAAWPISSADLVPFTAEAEDLLAVDSLPYDAAAFFTKLEQRAPALQIQRPQLDSSLSKFTPFSHRNLAHTLGRRLRTHSKARVILHAQATELLLASTRDHIEAVLVRTPAGQSHRIESDHIILAAGTIETVRLLLVSQIGNQHDQVGRNFHDHLTLTAATLREPARTQLLFALRPWIHRGTLHSLKLSASPGAPAPATTHAHPRPPHHRRAG